MLLTWRFHRYCMSVAESVTAIMNTVPSQREQVIRLDAASCQETGLPLVQGSQCSQHPECFAVTCAEATASAWPVGREVEYLVPLEEMGDLHLHVLVAAAPPDLTRAALKVHHRPCIRPSLLSAAHQGVADPEARGSFDHHLLTARDLSNAHAHVSHDEREAASWQEHLQAGLLLWSCPASHLTEYKLESPDHLTRWPGICPVVRTGLASARE